MSGPADKTAEERLRWLREEKGWQQHVLPQAGFAYWVHRDGGSVGFPLTPTRSHLEVRDDPLYTKEAWKKLLKALHQEDAKYGRAGAARKAQSKNLCPELNWGQLRCSQPAPHALAVPVPQGAVLYGLAFAAPPPPAQWFASPPPQWRASASLASHLRGWCLLHRRLVGRPARARDCPGRCAPRGRALRACVAAGRRASDGDVGRARRVLLPSCGSAACPHSSAALLATSVL